MSWQLLGLGSQEDIHAVVFQGNTLQLHGRHRDSLTLLPHTSASALMQPDSIGKGNKLQTAYKWVETRLVVYTVVFIAAS